MNILCTYHFLQAIMLMYDITSMASYQTLMKWLQTIHQVATEPHNDIKHNYIIPTPVCVTISLPVYRTYTYTYFVKLWTEDCFMIELLQWVWLTSIYIYGLGEESWCCVCVCVPRWVWRVW